MTSESDPPGAGCCAVHPSCVFARALQARAAVCELSIRQLRGERELIDCPSPVARENCATLAALMHERARFALRLPRPGELLMHAQALRLQCGGLAGLQQVLQAESPDVHRMIGAVHADGGRLADLPWDRIVESIVRWQGRRRHAPPR